MAGKNTAVFGIYRDRSSLESAIRILREAGFRNTDISVLAPENTGTKDLATEKHSKAPEGAAAGAGSGAVIGGILGWLAGIGSIAVPGIGPLLAAGPIVSILAGLGVVGAIGGITGALIGLGIPEYEAKRYAGKIRSGGILLSVHADNSVWVKRAKDALELTGAEDIGSESEAKADYAESDRPGAAADVGAREHPAEYKREPAGKPAYSEREDREGPVAYTEKETYRERRRSPEQRP